MASNTSKTVLLFGSTGATGKFLLRELLASNHFTKVVEAGRRVTTSEALSDATGKEKLVQKTIDFEGLDAAKLKDEKADVVVIVVGTTQKAAGSKDAFTRIDKEYVVNAAKAAKTDSDQRLVYLSSQAANPKSFFLYPRSKGETEQALASLNYKDFIAFRPGQFRDAVRTETRLLETAYRSVVGFLPFGRDSFSISVTTLARSIARAAELGSDGLPAVAASHRESPPGIPSYNIVPNKGAVALAKYSNP